MIHAYAIIICRHWSSLCHLMADKSLAILRPFKKYFSISEAWRVVMKGCVQWPSLHLNRNPLSTRIASGTDRLACKHSVRWAIGASTVFRDNNAVKVFCNFCLPSMHIISYHHHINVDATSVRRHPSRHMTSKRH